MFGRIVTGVAFIAAMIALAACSTVPSATQPQPAQPSVPSPPGFADISREAEPGLYTKAFVAEALRRYDAEGRDATLAYYNTPESIDGEWYLFVMTEDGEVLAHAAIPENVGLIAKPPLGIDANGYDFGAAMLAVTEQGAWVSYLYENPTRGGFLETKHTWVVKHDGLIFVSGWYQVIRYDAPPRPQQDQDRLEVRP